jgi:hypothetical protein
MGSTKLGIMGSNVIVPYVATTKRTKRISINSYVTRTGWTCSYAYAVFTADSSGNWFVELSFDATKSSGAESGDVSFVIGGVTFVTMTNGTPIFGFALQSGVAFRTFSNAYASSNSSTIYITLGGDTNRISVGTGLIPLSSEPVWAFLGTTAAAALEGILAADVYIAPATATSAGLVDTQAQNFAGVKTHATGAAVPTNPTTPIVAATQDGNIYSGTYTPTITNVAGTTIGTVTIANYLRVGKVVTVSGYVVVSFSDSTDRSFKITTPIARTSNFATVAGAAGVGCGVRGGGSYSVFNGIILGKVGEKTVQWESASNGADVNNDAHDFAYTFTYNLD